MAPVNNKRYNTLMINNEGGFTILETMIVTAVSAAMLVSAVTLFSGEQSKTQFNQSLRDIESVIQDVINDTETGYFPNLGDTDCDVSSGEPVIGSGGDEQGANLDCIFLGKTMHFRQDRIDVYPIIGVKNISAATTGLISSASPVAAPTLMLVKRYLWGLELYDIHFGTNSASRLSDAALVSIATSPNGTGFTGSNLNSGTQRINSHISSNPNGVSPATGTVSTINDSLQSITASSWPTPLSLVVLCFQNAPSGSVGRKFRGIVIAGGLQGIGTRIQVDTTGGDGFVCI